MVAAILCNAAPERGAGNQPPHLHRASSIRRISSSMIGLAANGISRTGALKLI
jgi:hypothetical protein